MTKVKRHFYFIITLFKDHHLTIWLLVRFLLWILLLVRNLKFYLTNFLKMKNKNHQIFLMSESQNVGQQKAGMKAANNEKKE